MRANASIFLLLCSCCSIESAKLKVAIIGAGYAGLCSARHALADGHNVTVFEQTSNFGGTWFYTDETDVDKYGIGIHTSLYQGLRTNSPKESMGMADISMTTDENTSYVSAETVYKFLQEFIKTFHLNDVIKFNHHVLNVKPFGESQWKIFYQNLPLNATETDYFDAVIVCNGHYSDAVYPNIMGKELFEGTQIHSHAYRKAENYNDKEVLIIGGGLSGIDIAYQLSKNSKVFFSHNKEHNPNHKFNGRVTLKGVVKQLKETSVEFIDGSFANITDIIYCTGYRYSYPFLDEKCDIRIDENFIQHLYRDCINIHHPTMAFIGVPSGTFTPILFDLQVRYYLKYLSGEMKLPSRDEMIAETNKEMSERFDAGVKKKRAHFLGFRHEQYFPKLAQEAKIKPVPPVMYSLYRYVANSRKTDPLDYRKIKYEILDDDTFTYSVVD